MKAILLLLTLLAATAPARADSWLSDPQVEAFILEMRERHGFDEALLRARFALSEPHPAVLRLIAPAASPTQRSWQRYRGRFLNLQRVRGGIRFWDEHRELIESASSRFGVPPEIIVSIIGVETEYGRNTGNFNVFQALATLAFRYPKRADFFRGELEQFLLLARENGLDLATARGSFAGAIGIPQFMPGSQRRFAVDFDGDGRIDLSGSSADAIGSVASFLAAHGWVAGRRVALPAALDAAPPAAWVEAGVRPTITAGAIRAAGIAAADLGEDDTVALIDLVTPGADTEYWWGFENFFVITRYNRSSFYAMSVYQLATALAGARAAPESLPETMPAKPARSGSRAKHRRAG